MHINLHSGRRYYPSIKAFQVCIREGNRNVRRLAFLLHPSLISGQMILLMNLPINRYAYFKKLDYFSTECIYSPDAYRGHARAFLKDLEAARPSAIIDIIHSGEAFEIKDEIKATQKAQRKCIPCQRGRNFPSRSCTDCCF